MRWRDECARIGMRRDWEAGFALMPQLAWLESRMESTDGNDQDEKTKDDG